jgi:hypothetical protein
MKTTVIATVTSIAFVLSIGVLATVYTQSAFAIGQTGASSGTNSGNSGSGGTAGNGGSGGIAVGEYASANGGSAEANAGNIDVQAHTPQKATCDTSGNTGSSGNSC